MSETFVKLFGSITDSSIWEEPSDVRIVWITMLAMADRHGYVGASVSGLARRAHVSREVVDAALAKFLAPDPESRSPDYDGRRIEVADRGWNLLNYERFRDMRDEEVRREYERNRKREQRDRSRDVPLVSRTSPISPTLSAQADPDPEAEADRESATRRDDTPTHRSDQALWPASYWCSRFKLAWEAKGVAGGTAFYGDTGDTKACGTLQDELEKLPAEVRLAAQARAPQMFAEFLSSSDWKTQKRKWPFCFFVQEFGVLRQSAGSTSTEYPRL